MLSQAYASLPGWTVTLAKLLNTTFQRKNRHLRIEEANSAPHQLPPSVERNAFKPVKQSKFCGFHHTLLRSDRMYV